MGRPQLSNDHVADPVKESLALFHRGVVDEVASTVQRDRVVIVGMAQNPFVKRARKLLEANNVTFTYLEYGSYLSRWKERLAIKLWAGFPTFPMVFVDGTLVGGFKDAEKLCTSGALKPS